MEQNRLPIIEDIISNIPFSEGDLAICKYVEKAALKLLRDRSSSQQLYDFYMFLKETKSTSEDISGFFLEFIAWAFINDSNREPFITFCKSNLFLHNKLIGIFAEKIIGLDYKSCSDRINKLCEDLDLEKSRIYLQYFKSIKKSQPAKIAIFLDNFDNDINYEIFGAALEDGDAEIIMKIDDFLLFSDGFRGYLLDALGDQDDLTESYINMDLGLMFKTSNLKHLLLQKNKACKDLVKSVDSIISRCKDSNNFDFLFEIAANGEVRKSVCAISEMNNPQKIVEFFERFKNNEYIKSLSAFA
jgi:hypothetical protein